MGYHDFGPLRISPSFTADDWAELALDAEADWRRAVDMLRDRIDGRFLDHARNCLQSETSGFVVLAIDSMLIEALEQFRRGIVDGRGRSGELIRSFLAGPRFQPQFDSVAANAFYEDIRCGLLHQAEARRLWLIRRSQAELLTTSRATGADVGYVIDVVQFHEALESAFDDYLKELVEPNQEKLRENLWSKMNHICRVRKERAGLFE
ncbi:hypothetical protein [Halomonas stenophila]|uniref:Flagellar biosynthesis regulator FlaF n=1 Tax=Halomonas stenophila TaxID=795312 RepID=A0A7W5EV36_9GAMM|nr:hypothetical protein [Halomonas stenophila]MBB3231959.1 flagellar biosynthesis regulator FlaF [Halomonas stenophila]